MVFFLVLKRKGWRLRPRSLKPARTLIITNKLKSFQLKDLLFMIYTYSPNWYKPQCLHFTNHSLYYCSNYLLYQYDLQSKKVVQELCFRQLGIKHNLNHKDIKITSIVSDQQTLLIGLNQPYMVRISKLGFGVCKIIKVESFETIEYIYLYKDGGEQFAVVCNKDGNMMKYVLNEEVNAFHKIEVKYKLSSIKAIYGIDHHHHCLVFTRGTILIFNRDFSKLQKFIEASSSDSIYSVDCYRLEKAVHFAFLLKNKENYTIIVFQFEYRQEFPLQFKKKLQEISTNIKKFYINFYYPKKFSQKLKQSQKASLSLKLINEKQLIVTGKLGQVNTLHLDDINQNQNISLKPYSYNQQENKEYETWTDSRHYKQIYFVYSHQNRLYLISTDHNLTIWQQQDKEIKYMYTIKFLTSSIQQLFYSQSDPRNIFALLKDSAIRSFTPLDQGSHQLNQFWKFSKKYKIKKAITHPNEQGMVGLVTQCNAIQLYDLYQDRLYKLIQIGEQILNISFQYPSIKPQLEAILKYQLKPQKYKNFSYLFKEIQNKTVMLVQTKSFLIIIDGLGEKEINCYRGKREKRLQRIHENRYWDERMLLSSHSKNNVLDVFIRYQKDDINLAIEVNYQQGRFLFKNSKESKIIYIINFKGTKFTIFKAQIIPEESRCEVILRSELIYSQPIDYFFINYKDERVAVYSQKDNAIMILHLDKIVADKYELCQNCEQIQIYGINYKIDTLMFYLEEFLIIATKDQAIKVVYYGQLPLLKPVEPKHKQAQKVVCQEIVLKE